MQFWKSGKKRGREKRGKYKLFDVEEDEALEVSTGFFLTQSDPISSASSFSGPHCLLFLTHNILPDR